MDYAPESCGPSLFGAASGVAAFFLLEGRDMSAAESLKKARERAKEMGLPYEGALTPREAQEILEDNPDAKLVDVRTRAELDWVGRVPGAVEVELQTWPGGRPNPDFMKQLEGK